MPKIKLSKNSKKEVSMRGVTTLYYSYLKYLSKERKKIALLQLTGRIEDYLVREFIWHAHTKHNFGVANIGSKNQQKIDICLLKGKLDNPTIYCMVEAKYFRNKHRLWDNATDEIGYTLKDLNRQLHYFNYSKHGNMEVGLISKSHSIYGLVFASYVNNKKDKSKKDKFYKDIKNAACKYFKYHDLPNPGFRKVFDDVKVRVLNTDFYVTLKGGLWKRRGG